MGMGRYRPPKPKSSAYITPAGFETLRVELQFLMREERPRVTAMVADAAAEGDRSENAAYIYGKKQLRRIDSRIRFLTHRMEVLTVVDNTQLSGEQVFFGAWVTVEDEDEEEQVWRIVGPDETDAPKGWISMDSPVGRALMRRRLADEVVVQRPKGDTALTIVDIRYTP